jgi:hypothetical protein
LLSGNRCFPTKSDKFLRSSFNIGGARVRFLTEAFGFLIVESELWARSLLAGIAWPLANATLLGVPVALMQGRASLGFDLILAPTINLLVEMLYLSLNRFVTSCAL